MPRKTMSTKSAVKRSPVMTSRTAEKPAAPVPAAAPAAEIKATPPVVAAAATTPAVAKAVEVKPTVAATTNEKPAVVAPVAPAAAPAAKIEPSPAFNAAVYELGSYDADTARDAATTLGRLGEAAAVEPLIRALINADGFYHCVVRAAAAESLGLLKDRRAVEPLLDAVSDPVAEVSLEAVRALAHIGDAHTAGALRQVVDDQTGFYVPMVRRAAEIALEQLAGR